MAESLEGEWDYNKRQFLMLEEKGEREKFSHLIATVTAEREVFISEGHKIVIAIEGMTLARWTQDSPRKRTSS